MKEPEFERKIRIAMEHRASAELRRIQSKKAETYEEHRYLLLLVGFHTIQADLWHKSAHTFNALKSD